MFCCVPQQTCLLCHAAGMSAVSAVSHSRHVCFVMQQTCLLCHTADMAAVPHSMHVCFVIQQACLLCHTADMSAVPLSRHVCYVTQVTCPPCDTADMYAVSRSRQVGDRVAGPLQTTSLLMALPFPQRRWETDPPRSASSGVREMGGHSHLFLCTYM